MCLCIFVKKNIGGSNKFKLSSKRTPTAIVIDNLHDKWILHNLFILVHLSTAGLPFADISIEQGVNKLVLWCTAGLPFADISIEQGVNKLVLWWQPFSPQCELSPELWEELDSERLGLIKLICQEIFPSRRKSQINQWQIKYSLINIVNQTGQSDNFPRFIFSPLFCICRMLFSPLREFLVVRSC